MKLVCLLASFFGSFLPWLGGLHLSSLWLGVALRTAGRWLTRSLVPSGHFFFFFSSSSSPLVLSVKQTSLQASEGGRDKDSMSCTFGLARTRLG